MITALFDAVSYRDLAEIRGWAEELAEDPALATSPFATAVLGIAAEAVYHRAITFGPTGSPTPGRSWRAMTPDRGKGNWTHLWATLRNLADLLRRLDDMNRRR